MSTPPVSSRLTELFRAYRIACNPRYADSLAACGLKQDGPIWGFDFVEFSHLTYRPVLGGDCAVIVPVFDDGVLADLVACRITDRRIATRYGAARALGENRVDLAILRKTRLPLYSDPLRRLVNGRRGAVVLDWNQAGRLLHGVKSIGCDSAALAHRVDAAMDADRRQRLLRKNAFSNSPASRSAMPG